MSLREGGDVGGRGRVSVGVWGALQDLKIALANTTRVCVGGWGATDGQQHCTSSALQEARPMEAANHRPLGPGSLAVTPSVNRVKDVVVTSLRVFHGAWPLVCVCVGGGVAWDGGGHITRVARLNPATDLTAIHPEVEAGVCGMGREGGGGQRATKAGSKQFNSCANCNRPNDAVNNSLGPHERAGGYRFLRLLVDGFVQRRGRAFTGPVHTVCLPFTRGCPNLTMCL